MGFYENFSRKCFDAGLSMTAALAEVGMPAANISKWKSGSVPKPSTIYRLCDHFGWDADSLLSSESKKQTDYDTRNGLSDAQVQLLSRIILLSDEKCEAILTLLDD